MTSGGIERGSFGRLSDGTVVERVTLRGAHGFEAAIIPFGAALQALVTPDRDGHCDDIVLGHDDLDGYLAQRKFFGATIGRYANRIAGARFTTSSSDGSRSGAGDEVECPFIPFSGKSETSDATDEGPTSFGATLSARDRRIVLRSPTRSMVEIGCGGGG